MKKQQKINSPTKLYNIIPFFITLVVTLVSSLSMAATSVADNLTPATNTLVTAKWLSEHLTDENLVLLDTSVVITADKNGEFKPASGFANYQKGHIPTAGFADLISDLSNNDSPLDFAMPSPEQFRQKMGELGLGPESRVVLYSKQRQVWPARLWWMLRWAGFDNVALLDGGLNAWTAQGGELSTKPATHSAKQFPLSLRKDVIADSNEVLKAIDNPNVNLVDALSDAHFNGQFTMYARPGHIPSATNIPSSSLLDEAGLYKPIDELEIMQKLNPNQRVITYCGGGVAASSVAFTMVRLGYKNVAVYMGSLSEWTEDATKPMTTTTP